MTFPLIAIFRLDAGLYEWHLIYGNNVVDTEAGDSSITGCLSSAIDCIPDDERLVEVRYRGIHMGTFHIQSLRVIPSDVADKVSEMYATYMEAVS